MPSLETSLDIIGSIVRPQSQFDIITEGLGPSLGGLLASGVYMFLKFLRYEEVNGTADRDETSHNRVLLKSDLHKFLNDALTPMSMGGGQRTSYFEPDSPAPLQAKESPSATTQRGDNVV